MSYQVVIYRLNYGVLEWPARLSVTLIHEQTTRVLGT